jgi:hypothetical protein
MLKATRRTVALRTREELWPDQEETLAALLKAACEGWVETDLAVWRPQRDASDDHRPRPHASRANA